jgi:hypothetical protein
MGSDHMKMDDMKGMGEPEKQPTQEKGVARRSKE